MRQLNRPLLVCMVLVLAHIVWGLARLPGRVVQRRLADVQQYREGGDAAYLLPGAPAAGSDAIAWVRANTPAECVVLWRGEPMGALEFAPTLLAPRLIVEARLCPPTNQTYAGLPVARGTRDGRSGTVVLVATKKMIAVEVQ